VCVCNGCWDGMCLWLDVRKLSVCMYVNVLFHESIRIVN